MAVIGGRLTCIYNLGKHEAELQVDQDLTESETLEAVMDRVKFQRYRTYHLPLLVNLTYTHQTSSAQLADPIFSILVLISSISVSTVWLYYLIYF